MKLYQKAPKTLADLTFGKLYVVKRSNKPGFWICRCACGKICEKHRGKIISGHTRSCGCLRSANAKLRFTKHGVSYKIPEYRTWVSMKARCLCPSSSSYHLYGAKGIIVCDRWLHSFENFLSDVGYRPSNQHSLDRINPMGNYEPSNVKWSTRIEQASNKTTNKTLRYNGKIMTLAEIARTGSVPYLVFYRRLKKNWPIDLALTAPYKKRGCYKSACPRRSDT